MSNVNDILPSKAVDGPFGFIFFLWVVFIRFVAYIFFSYIYKLICSSLLIAPRYWGMVLVRVCFFFSPSVLPEIILAPIRQFMNLAFPVEFPI